MEHIFEKYPDTQEALRVLCLAEGGEVIHYGFLTIDYPFGFFYSFRLGIRHHSWDQLFEPAIVVLHRSFLPALLIVGCLHTTGKSAQLPATLTGEIQIANFQI